MTTIPGGGRMPPRQYSLGNLRGALEALRDYPDDVMVTVTVTPDEDAEPLPLYSFGIAVERSAA